MRKIVGVSELKKISVLYEGDVYELACTLLKIYDAKAQGTNTNSRATVVGLFKIYAQLASMDERQVIAIAEQNKLPLGAVVNYDNQKWP
ncbi:MAG: hypothetical protein NTW32_22885 [Chloroflexi bacterium]|nr:hypothetical protein [Chloroflexota bacterium]